MNVLNRQIAELERAVDRTGDHRTQGRSGPRGEQALWQRRIEEKNARLAEVRDSIAVLDRKIADVTQRRRG